MSQRDHSCGSPGLESYVSLAFDRELGINEVEQVRRSLGAQAAVSIPSAVADAYGRARELGFSKSSRPEVGALISVLASAVPGYGRVLELGTGAGLGLAWVVYGLGERNDVEVVSIEIDPVQAAFVANSGWPEWVSIVAGDALEIVPTMGAFDLIFLDVPDAKNRRLCDAVAALRPGGKLLIDDMGLPGASNSPSGAGLATIRDQLFSDRRLVCAELAYSSGMILAVRRRD
ncbi:class I SAM-dependent methyltransferase [Streptomyces sp. LX-29]|uniref:O-methyltransferase n=1 Tax=Streptomyces sp. LX-29 TaxID=2900152 RepID=UPI00240DE796|nr:class I SAM-dependent methyltransferase [Streptomyces sp. LX-29]WFB10504.1 class I SAM-dependent methyltransferase [Streptomyces sp. LX-29]